MDLATLVARLALALVFGLAGALKLFALRRSRDAMSEFGIPAWLADPASVAPPVTPGTAWTVQQIYGTGSIVGLAVGPLGVIYGTTFRGGSSTACGNSEGCGTLFQLTPPATTGGAWQSTVLHNFTGQTGDGYQPNGGLVVTKQGVVYGTTYYGGAAYFGTVFEYRP